MAILLFGLRNRVGIMYNTPVHHRKQSMIQELTESDFKEPASRAEAERGRNHDECSTDGDIVAWVEEPCWENVLCASTSSEVATPRKI